ncbi:MAG: proton-conducting transporter membrane subunit, partial [Thiobacillus sp.]|nr:proton-conducting transporter membrane subunit [Thiobacillus sp.]
MFGQSILSLVIWVPILAGVAVLATGSDRNAALARWVALIGALLGLIVAIPPVTGFDTGTSAMQFVEKAAWIPAFNIHYHLGVDGISMPLILLNSFITVLVVIAGWQVIQDKIAQYKAAFLIMSGLINGVFAALDGILFYVFFESMLIPLYLIIGVWGGPKRVYAAFKFFLYTLLGSLLMLVSMIYLYFQSGGSFDIQTWHTTTLGMTA